MKGSENSLQQTLSLFRKRIAPIMGTESTPPFLPRSLVKLTAEAYSLPPDETLSTVTDIVKAYGESIRKATVTAAKNDTPLSEDIAKHIKSYSGLVATQARLQATVMKSRPVGPAEDASFKERADRAWEQLTDGGRDTHTMAEVADKFLMRLEKNVFSWSRILTASGLRLPASCLAEGGPAKHLTISFQLIEKFGLTRTPDTVLSKPELCCIQNALRVSGLLHAL